MANFKSGYQSTLTWNGVTINAEDITLPDDTASMTKVMTLTGIDKDYDGPQDYGFVQWTQPEDGGVSLRDDTSHAGACLATRIAKTCSFVGYVVSDKRADVKRGQGMKRVVRVELTQAPVWS